jgi:hypothetical protein
MVLVFMQSAGNAGQILAKLQHSRQLFEKFLNTKFHEIRPVGADRRTDGQADT